MSKINSIKQFVNKVRIKFSDIIAKSIASWTFVFLYTASMIAWIILHSLGILNIDSMDFIKYNLFLSWAAGIQASIILMVSNRELEKDRETIQKSLELDEKTLELADTMHKADIQNISKINTMIKKINSMSENIEKLEEIIEEMEDEERVIQDEKRKK